MLPPEPIELPVEIPMEPLSIFLPVLTVEAKPVEIDTSPVTPSFPASSERIVTAPLDVSVDFPDERSKLPPDPS